MGYSRGIGTTAHPPVPKALYSECKREFLADINDKRVKYKIPPELVINTDQTPSSYVLVGRKTMAQCGKNVPVKGSNDRRNITLTLVVTLVGFFLPFQIIYAGKSKASQPCDAGFCISQNPSHWSNEEKMLKLIREVINLYVVNKKAELRLPETQKSMVI